ncbi:unnamed protein product [Sordaria macrospora k-hell]|uniref:WGS project CABT00000000 data, contig 2.10 n=1 Tax=Sordaria macrospora (strain ATCC MYA-333 / DSM 997 / K(L3346) / K-hell) TaxID=771870 RepID=F7VWK0_SORMK|nr:uncharacterized protein SMAC_03324 [Sordaria macrospora k-hell]CCC09768.1 unnamed protein product [Sordaria macrospora k-hell]
MRMQALATRALLSGLAYERLPTIPGTSSNPNQGLIAIGTVRLLETEKDTATQVNTAPSETPAVRSARLVHLVVGVMLGKYFVVMAVCPPARSAVPTTAIAMPAKYVPTTELAPFPQAVEVAVEVAVEEEEEEEEEVVVPAPAVPQERNNVMQAGACRWEVSAALLAKGGIAM